MLPSRLPIGHLDIGIRAVVINLNRIPGVFTNTTCEGHIWRDIPAWPTKDGWIHFNVQNGTNPTLISRIKKEFVESHPIFELEEGGNNLYDDFLHYTMEGHYESHDGGNLFDRINEQEQQQYFERAEIRRKEILRGWLDFNKVVASYLADNFGKDYKKLPFRAT